MAESAVTDRPADAAVTEAAAVTPTEDSDVTEGAAAVQTDAVTETTDDNDLTAVAAAAAREAAIEEGRELGRQEALRERSSASEAESRRQLRELYPATVRALEADLNNLGITDSAHRQQVINHLNNLNMGALRAALAPFEEATQELLPESARGKFNEAANGKTAVEYQRTFVEHMADHDPAIRNRIIRTMTLEDFEAASAKNKATLAARDAAKFEDGRRKGRTDPAGESKGEERVTAPALNSTYENDAAFNRGEITREEWKSNNDRLRGARS